MLHSFFTEKEAKRFGLTWCVVCEDYIGGSHYHCGNCGETSSMLGHYSEGEFTCEKVEDWRPEGWGFDLAKAQEDFERKELARLKEKYGDS